MFAGSVDADANDEIVFANNAISSSNLTLAAGTAYNKYPVGLKDMCESTSVHSLSSATAANWDVALSSSTAGRFSILKHRKCVQAVQNKGGGKIDLRIIANGVQNDIVDGQLGAVRFSSGESMEFDGSYKSKGVTDFTSRKVPNGHVWELDKDALGKILVTPMPTEGAPAWGDGDKAEDRNALKFSTDFAFALVCKNRRLLTQHKAQTEQ